MTMEQPEAVLLKISRLGEGPPAIHSILTVSFFIICTDVLSNLSPYFLFKGSRVQLPSLCVDMFKAVCRSIKP
jgi:hypothetical protein